MFRNGTYLDSSRSKPITRNEVADVLCTGTLPAAFKAAASSLSSCLWASVSDVPIDLSVKGCLRGTKLAEYALDSGILNGLDTDFGKPSVSHSAHIRSQASTAVAGSDFVKPRCASCCWFRSQTAALYLFRRVFPERSNVLVTTAIQDVVDTYPWMNISTNSSARNCRLECHLEFPAP